MLWNSSCVCDNYKKQWFVYVSLSVPDAYTSVGWCPSCLGLQHAKSCIVVYNLECCIKRLVFFLHLTDYLQLSSNTHTISTRFCCQQKQHIKWQISIHNTLPINKPNKQGCSETSITFWKHLLLCCSKQHKWIIVAGCISLFRSLDIICYSKCVRSLSILSSYKCLYCRRYSVQ